MEQKQPVVETYFGFPLFLYQAARASAMISGTDPRKRERLQPLFPDYAPQPGRWQEDYTSSASTLQEMQRSIIRLSPQGLQSFIQEREAIGRHHIYFFAGVEVMATKPYEVSDAMLVYHKLAYPGSIQLFLWRRLLQALYELPAQEPYHASLDKAFAHIAPLARDEELTPAAYQEMTSIVQQGATFLPTEQRGLVPALLAELEQEGNAEEPVTYWERYAEKLRRGPLPSLFAEEKGAPQCTRIGRKHFQGLRALVQTLQGKFEFSQPHIEVVGLLDFASPSLASPAQRGDEVWLDLVQRYNQHLAEVVYQLQGRPNQELSYRGNQ